MKTFFVVLMFLVFLGVIHATYIPATKLQVEVKTEPSLMTFGRIRVEKPTFSRNTKVTEDESDLKLNAWMVILFSMKHLIYLAKSILSDKQSAE